GPLHPLRPFFGREIPDEEGLTIPELFEESRRAAVSASESRRLLDSVGAHCPPMDAHLLDRYFDHYVATGAIPCAPRRRRSESRGSRRLARVPALDRVLPQITASLAADFDDDSLQISDTRITAVDTDDS